jgi:vitellogenic carboxypeptidase-like protein
MYGLFFENGPVKADNGTFQKNPHSWHQRANMLYIDNPVGTGFSFTGDPEGYSTNQSSIAKNLHEALLQFYKLFPELKSRDFYISAQSYGGKYCASLGEKILKDSPYIKLKGVLIGNGWVDPTNQLNYADYYYQLGLISAEQKSVIEINKFLIKSLIFTGNYKLALGVLKKCVDLTLELTGFKSVFNFVNENQDPEDDVAQWKTLVEDRDLMKAFHLGNRGPNPKNAVLQNLLSDYMVSVAPSLNFLLSRNVRMIFYYGQFDLAVPYVPMLTLLKNLDFEENDLLRKAARVIWRVDGKVAGYAKTAGPVIEVLVRNAGHLTQIDQPQRIFDLFDRFIGNRPFDDPIMNQ